MVIWYVITLCPKILASEGHFLSQELAFRLLLEPHPDPNLNSLALRSADFAPKMRLFSQRKKYGGTHDHPQVGLISIKFYPKFWLAQF